MKRLLLFLAWMCLIPVAMVTAMDYPENEETDTQLVTDAQDATALSKLFTDKRVGVRQALMILVNEQSANGTDMAGKINFVLDQFDTYNPNERFANSPKI